MKKTTLIMFLLIWGVALNSHAVVMEFPDFSDSSSLVLNGNAQTLATNDGYVLRLTEASGSQSGSAFSSVMVNASNFSTYFKFRITEPGGSIFDCNTEVGADGIVFVVQSVASDIGGGGQGIGYAGIATSLGVEFDTWCNGANNDPGSNHVAVDFNGSVVHVDNPAIEIQPDFDDGNVWHAWVDYNGTILELRVGQSSVRPSDPTLSQQVDLPVLLGRDDAYIGFTSGTGADWGNHDIIAWEYRDSFDPIEPDCDEEYDNGYEAGRQACIQDPASCGIQMGGDYDQGYQDGYDTAQAECNNGSGDECAYIDEELNIYISNAVYEFPLADLNFWLDFTHIEGTLTWELDDYGIME